ncbi:NAD(P)/FAD-dependent oxidoreductase [Alloalcanivorax profundimaris]|uniref:NAD(P)/FAD-dependent oxidoreductase n=1 Tax=Alloalcanivorax profundimaris TaxID=2735259 RepID=UPI0018878D36|nr:FAD-dependent oxidoreductase [Alloalcanivorax profundimaris]MBF1800536.1 NAD(P)/FAD-dependent oxidoreductase [Alloalcanivorax profundimaris]MCQ6262328.1 FAD-dependent oxidoreductase [Alcanivorax sp. MM125-6]
MTARRLVVVGNGMAARRLLEELLARAPRRYRITVVGDEPGAGYNRVMLSPLLAGATGEDAIVTHPAAWYRRHGIRLISGTPVTAIDRRRRQVRTGAGHRLAYDRLVLATGAAPRRLALPGADLDGVLSFRDLADTRRLQGLAPRALVVVGGGFLGLEAAEALLRRGHRVTLVHGHGHPLNQQLDASAGARLRADLEARGLRFVLNHRPAALESDGRGAVTAVRLDDGRRLPADAVIQAVGIEPRVALARQCGLALGRHGVRVDDTLQTFDPRVYAVGECVEHRGRTFGLVAPLYHQARVCAGHLAEQGLERYHFEGAATRLKIGGIDLLSAGDFLGGEGDQVITLDDPAGGYRRLVLRDHRLVGLVLYGDVADGPFYETLWREGRDLSALRLKLPFGEAACAPSRPAAAEEAAA